MNPSFTTPYFVPGGTLPPDAPSYIKRQADEDLYTALLQGEFCYILTSRQVGKSSLTVQVGMRLREANIQVAFLNLNTIGHAELTQEQWYFSLLMQFAENVHQEEAFEAFWRTCRYPSPLQKWTVALRYLLVEIHPVRLVIFIDEIDQVRALPFSTADFFASIRDCYNRRAQSVEYERLTFCLIGSALPAQLIDDPRVTPFNIGRRVQVRDFTTEEAAPLALGFEYRDRQRGTDVEAVLHPQHAAMLARVLYWTGGHPYLTQRLCRAIVEAGAVETTAQVDGLCRDLFLSAQAQEEEDNLTFVRDRLLESREDAAGLLNLYSQVFRGRQIPAAKSNRLLEILTLSGIVRSRAGRIEVRNRIYKRVFNRQWVEAHMPDAEKRRQRAAYRLGVLRTVAASLFALVFIAIASLSLLQSRVRRRLETEKSQLRVTSYTGMMNLAQRNWEEGNVRRTLDILETQRPHASSLEAMEPDLRGFEWHYLWTLCHQDQATLRGHSSLVFTSSFSPDGKTLATGGFDGKVALWNMDTRRLTRSIAGNRGDVKSLGYSPQGDLLAIGYEEGTLLLWDTAKKQERSLLRGKKESLLALAWSPDGRRLATGGTDKMITLWDTQTGRRLLVLTGHTDYINALVFCPEGKSIVSSSRDKTIRLWNIATRKSTLLSVPQTDEAPSLALTRTGRTLAIANRAGNIWLWDTKTRACVALPKRHLAQVQSMAFSPDGGLLASASWDYTLELWDVRSHKSIRVEGHADRVNTVAFSPDGQTIASGSSDHTVKIWKLKDLQAANTIPILEKQAYSMALSSDGKVLATCITEVHNAKMVYKVALWATGTKNFIRALDGQGKSFSRGSQSGAFSPNGKTLAWPTEDGSVCLWDVRTGTLRAWKASSVNVNTVSFSPDGKLIATGARDGQVRVWDAADLQQKLVLRDGPGDVASLVFSGDVKTLAAAYNKPQRIVLFDV